MLLFFFLFKQALDFYLKNVSTTDYEDDAFPIKPVKYVETDEFAKVSSHSLLFFFVTLVHFCS